MQGFLVRARLPLKILGGLLFLCGVFTFSQHYFLMRTPMEESLFQHGNPCFYCYGQSDLFRMISSLGTFRIGGLVLMAVGVVVFVVGIWATRRTKDLPGPEDLD